MQNTQPQTLDQDVVNLTKAIRQVESGGKYDAPGASGEFGGYQFMPDTWKAYAAEAGINVPLEQATREQQNQVAYTKIKQWKDAGKNVGQVASMWNAGPGKENAYIEGHAGTNSQGVAYDTGAYAQKVAQAYQQIKQGGQLGGNYVQPPQAHQYVPAAATGAQTLQDQLGIQEGGFFSDLGQDFSNLGQNINAATQNEYNIGSKGLQTVGAGAGLVGDVIDTGLSNLPVVGGAYEKATEVAGEFIGGGLEATGAADWLEAHPEAAGNIMAALDIASVIPFFKALKLGTKGIRDAGTVMREGKVVKEAGDEIESSLSKQTGRTVDRSKARGVDPVKVLLDDPKLLPEVIEQNGKYIYETKQGVQALKQSLDADEKALQNLFESTLKGKQNVGVNLADVKAKVLADVLPKGKIKIGKASIEREINRIFDDVFESGGRNWISLSDLNDIKRQVRGNINFGATDPFRALGREVEFDVGQSLMKQVEKIAEKAGAQGVKEINQTMSGKLGALSILEDLGGKAIKSGSKPKDGLIKSVGKTIPVVEGVVNYASRGTPLTPTKRLRDKSPLKQTARKGLMQVGAGLGLSGQYQPESE